MNEIAKAGWLYRESNILRRWKRNWFVLYVNGDLKFFESKNSFCSEETIVVPVEVRTVFTGAEVDVNPPNELSRDYLLALNFRDGTVWTLCCESLDDMRAWEFAIEQAREQAPPAYSYSAPPLHNTMGAPPHVHNMMGPTAPPYDTFRGDIPGIVHSRPGQQGQQVYYGQHPHLYTQQYASHPGGTTIIYNDPDDYYHSRRRRGYCRRGYDGGDLAMGMVAGAAVGSLMWGPLMWW